VMMHGAVLQVPVSVPSENLYVGATVPSATAEYQAAAMAEQSAAISEQCTMMEFSQNLDAKLHSRVSALEVLTESVSTELHSSTSAHGSLIQKIVDDLTHIREVQSDPWFSRISQAARPMDYPDGDFEAALGTKVCDLKAELQKFVDSAYSNLREYSLSIKPSGWDDLDRRATMLEQVLLGHECCCVLTAPDTCNVNARGWHVRKHADHEDWLPPETHCTIPCKLARRLSQCGMSSSAQADCRPLEQLVLKLEAAVGRHDSRIRECLDQIKVVHGEVAAQPDKPWHDEMVPVIQRLVMSAVNGLATECDKEFSRIHGTLKALSNEQ